MRPRALTGQRTGSELAEWLMRSPRTAFFWSAKVRWAWVTRRTVFASFKGASGPW